MTKHNQARFHNGRLIATETQSDSSAETKRTTPGNGTGFTVEVKPGALDANAVLHRSCERPNLCIGSILAYRCQWGAFKTKQVRLGK